MACLSIATHLGTVSWAVPLPPQAEAHSHCQLDRGAASSAIWREQERDLGSSSDSYSAPSATEKPNPFCREEGRHGVWVILGFCVGPGAPAPPAAHGSGPELETVPSTDCV